MTHVEFLEAFENCTLAEFHHTDHIRMAWLYLRKFGFQIGADKIIDGIKRFAASKNSTQLYHETITRFWIHVVQHAIESMPHENFSSLITKISYLTNAGAIYQHYSQPFLMSERARHEFCEPDLLRLPLLNG